VRVSVALLVSALLSLTLASAAMAKTPQRSKTWTWAFEADTLGKPPANTGVFGGTWAVVVDSSSLAGGGAASAAARSGAAPESLSAAPHDSSLVGSAAAALSAGAQPVAPPAAPARRILRQSETDDGTEFHYVQFTKPVIEDLSASVRFRIESGDIDPTAGILFQLDKKGKSGYLVRVSGQKKAVIAHYLLYGKRRDIKVASIDPPEPGTWHTLAIERKGSVLVVYYDGKECFMVRDERYSKGSVGLWTEDDTVADFADLKVSTK